MKLARWRLWCCAVLLGALVQDGRAQPRRERQTHSLVMELRHRLWLESRGRDRGLLDQVARDLLGEGAPIEPLAAALARVRGVAADRAFGFRFAVQCLATPEVVDLDRFREIHLTMHTPYRPKPAAGDVEFRLRILDRHGEVRWRGAITESTGPRDLLHYRATVAVPVHDLPDGRYAVEVDTWLDGQGPRPTDPVSRAAFCVVRGFQDRVEDLRRRSSALPAESDPDSLALLRGNLAEIERLFVGEPPQGESDATAALQQADAILANLEAGRPALAGLTGWVTVGIATASDEAALASLRLVPPPAEGRRPLVLLVPGAAAWDHAWSRPTSPPSVSPHWLRDALLAHGLDPDRRWQLAVLESPGRYADAGQAVAAAVAQLRTLLDLAPETVLVAEREGAMAVALALTRDPQLATGVAWVGGGSLDAAAAGRLGALRMLAVPCVEHPANANLLRAVDLLRDAGATVRVGEARPWPIAVPLALPELERFVADVLRN